MGGLAIPNHLPQNLLASPTVNTLAAGGSLAPWNSMKSFAPEVPQLACGVSAEQQMESGYPASLVHGVVVGEGGSQKTKLFML